MGTGEVVGLFFIQAGWLPPVVDATGGGGWLAGGWPDCYLFFIHAGTAFGGPGGGGCWAGVWTGGFTTEVVGWVAVVCDASCGGGGCSTLFFIQAGGAPGGLGGWTVLLAYACFFHAFSAMTKYQPYCSIKYINHSYIIKYHNLIFLSWPSFIFQFEVFGGFALQNTDFKA